ncbi:MAG TPA: hypothetical protein VLM76_11700 [Patescibacteria group bacterium]|nr:hypothetical protein [Patescibacteria group bacterium]
MKLFRIRPAARPVVGLSQAEALARLDDGLTAVVALGRSLGDALVSLGEALDIGGMARQLYGRIAAAGLTGLVARWVSGGRRLESRTPVGGVESDSPAGNIEP